MANGDPYKIIVSPLSDFIESIGDGVAQAQRALDDTSLDTWKRVQTDPALQELRDIGYQPTWYAIPEVRAEIKLAFHFEAEQTGRPGRLLALPINPTTQTRTSVKSEGTSQLVVRIVPIPPPVGVSGEQG